MAGGVTVTLKDEHPTNQDIRKSLGASVEDNQNRRYWAGMSKHLDSDDSGSDECKSTNKQYSFAGRQAMCMASLLWQKRPWFFRIFRVFRVFRGYGTFARVASTPRYEIGKYDR